MQTPDQVQKKLDWKRRTYILGGLLGSLMGLMTAYLFTRAAEEEGEAQQAPSVSTGTLIGLALSILALVRQIAESGKPKKR